MVVLGEAGATECLARFNDCDSNQPGQIRYSKTAFLVGITCTSVYYSHFHLSWEKGKGGPSLLGCVLYAIWLGAPEAGSGHRQKILKVVLR